MEEKNISFFRFEDLRIYAKSVDYSSWLISNLPNPKNEAEKSLIESFCRSANDIALNIAEGSSRNKTQFDRFLKISKTAIRECVFFTSACQGVGMFDENQVAVSRGMLMELTRMIGALIVSLQRGSHNRRTPSTAEVEEIDEFDDIESIDDDINTDFTI